LLIQILAENNINPSVIFNKFGWGVCHAVAVHSEMLCCQIHQLTETCWDTCMTDRMKDRLDSKVETCLTNCVERFIDVSLTITGRFQQMLQRSAQQ